MEYLLFIIFLMVGIFLGIVLTWKLNISKSSHEEEISEEEIVESLSELKTYIVPEQKKASKEYDLLEIALEHDVSDITIVNEEGLPIASTLADSEELAAKYSGIYQYIKNSTNRDITKISIRDKNGYTYILSISKDGIPLYLIVTAKIEITSLSERTLLNRIMPLLDKYLGQNSEDNLKI